MEGSWMSCGKIKAKLSEEKGPKREGSAYSL
jgi:hypothetical protein